VSSPINDARAHELRCRYRERFGFGDFPVPVEAIAEDLLGLDVQRIEMDCSGMLLPAERRILVNADEGKERQTFTIAHELGHWICQCLEKGSVEAVYCRTADVMSETARHAEREANVFAAELLMPEDQIRTPGATAEGFGVSDLAYRWRLYSFGLGERPEAT
jgi:Zn-dependent peptidase ImmA (M78 family)